VTLDGTTKQLRSSIVARRAAMISRTYRPGRAARTAAIRRRQPTSSASFADRVLSFRRQFHRWGKDRFTVLLRQQLIGVFLHCEPHSHSDETAGATD
jgi:hypothetical protein